MKYTTQYALHFSSYKLVLNRNGCKVILYQSCSFRQKYCFFLLRLGAARALRRFRTDLWSCLTNIFLLKYIIYSCRKHFLVSFICLVLLYIQIAARNDLSYLLFHASIIWGSEIRKDEISVEILGFIVLFQDDDISLIVYLYRI